MNRFLLLLLFCWSSATKMLAQNVGINNTAPAFPLSFSNAWGTKISLWGDANAHYGIAAQPTMMQFFTDIPSAHIGFGYATSGNFNERMRIINGGIDGMQLNGRIVLRNGSSPLNLAAGPGIWLSRPDNSSLGGFMGVQNNTNIGFYGAGTGWGLVYNIDNGRVGLGTSTPVNRLDIAGLNNWDLTNTEGDVRIGNDNHRLKFGVALQGGGSGASSIMQSGGVGLLTLGANSKNLVQLNGGNNSLDLMNLTGGLRVDGNAGTAGQQLESRGNGAAPVWKSKPYFLAYAKPGDPWNTYTELIGTNVETIAVPGLDNLSFFLPEGGQVEVAISAYLNTIGLGASCSGGFWVEIWESATNTRKLQLVASGLANGYDGVSLQRTDLVNLNAGFHQIRARHRRGHYMFSGDSRMYQQKIILHVYPN